MENGNSLIAVVVLFLIGLVVVIALIPFTIVDTTERAVILNLGRIDRVVDAGIHWVTPLTESVETFTISTQKAEVEATAASKDLQDVTTLVAVQYNLDPERVGDIYTEYRDGVYGAVIDPAIQDSVKSATASFTAEELITQRVAVKDSILKRLQERLSVAHIRVTNVDIVNFTFSESFNQAIEQKVTAEQQAKKAENDLARVQFEAQQQIERAKAEAESIRIQAEAVTSQGGADYVKLKAIEKWKGDVPTHMIPGATIPFIELN